MTQVAAPEAARTLARRFNARARYRRNRDRTIAVDLIGSEYRDNMQHLWRLVEYDPRSHQVRFTAVNTRGSVKLDTDTFWQWLRRKDWTPA